MTQQFAISIARFEHLEPCLSWPPATIQGAHYSCHQRDGHPRLEVVHRVLVGLIAHITPRGEELPGWRPWIDSRLSIPQSKSP